MDEREFMEYYEGRGYRRVIKAIARKLTWRFPDLEEDLEQEGAIALWRLDLSRATTNPDAWIRQAIKFRMVDFLRYNHPKRFVSLTAMLERGDQLETNEAGELHLISEGPLDVRLYDEAEWEQMREEPR